jgi:hypothetical protein
MNSNRHYQHHRYSRIPGSPRPYGLATLSAGSNQLPAAQQQGQQAEGADIQVQQPAPQITVSSPRPR